MAGLASYNDKLMQDEDPNNPQQGQFTPTQAEGSAPAEAGTSGVVDGANSNPANVSTAGLGAGGTGGWTNIQAYLNANKGDTGSAKLLDEKAGGVYDNESKLLNDSAEKTKADALGQANKVNEVKENAHPWINQAANAYSWEGDQNSAYKDNVDKIKHGLYDSYSGPENFAYGKSADFQKYNSAFGNDGAFNNLITDFQKEKAGGQLNRGQADLQTQLDVNNQNLADSRQNYLKKYAGFDDEISNKVKDSDSAIQNAKTQYGNNQSQLRSTLQNYGNQYDTSRQQKEADARAGYNTSLNSASGRDSAKQSSRGFDWAGPVHDVANTTWRQIEQERDEDPNSFYNSLTVTPYIDVVPGSAVESRGGYDEYMDQARAQGYATAGQRRTDNVNNLNNFYGQQDAQYANTGDEEKRNWNTIMDILNSQERQKQGFAVRG